jgi:phosphoglycolate phosphatase-like HAD superfamily hydrolase
MIKNIIFDWSGVINDSVENFVIVVNKMFKEFGGPTITLEELKENWKQPYMEFYNKYVPSLTLEDQRTAYKKYMAQSPESKPFPGIVEVIKKFKARGISMVILTSDYQETLLPEIQRFGLEGVFSDRIFGIYDKYKGAVELVSRNKFVKEETIFIGDSNYEIEAGKKCGIKTGAVTWGYCPRKKLEELEPDFLITNLEEFEKAILG